MALYRVDPDDLEGLARTLADVIEQLALHAGAAGRTMAAMGYADQVRDVDQAASWTGSWGVAWEGSLRVRSEIARRAAELPMWTRSDPTTTLGLSWVEPSTHSAWQILAGVPAAVRRHAAGCHPGVSVDETAGAVLATELLDALESGDSGAVLAVVDDLTTHLTDLPLLRSFYRALDADITGLLPAMVLDLDVGDAELHRYLGPLATGLAILERHDELPFTIQDLMAGHEDRSVSPIAYFGLGDFRVSAMIAALLPVLAATDAGDVVLDGPEFRMPDGSIASPDPRVVALGRLAALDGPDRRFVVRTVVDVGLLAAILDPRTRLADGGRSVAALLSGLGDADEDLDLLVAAMGEIDGATPRAVVVAVSTAIARHLASLLAENRRWGLTAVDIAPTPLRAELDLLPDRGERLVTGFLKVAVSHDDARQVLDAAAAALLIDQFTAAIATIDFGTVPPEHLGQAIGAKTVQVGDDVGTLLGMIIGTSLAVDVSHGRSSDEMAAVGLDVASIGIGLLVAGLAGGLGAGVLVRDALGAVAGSGTVVDGALEGSSLDTRQAELVALDGYDRLEAVEDFAVFTIAAELHRLGILELPPGLVAPPGGIVRAGAGDWAALRTAVAAAGIDPEMAFAAADTVKGYVADEIDRAIDPSD